MIISWIRIQPLRANNESRFKIRSGRAPRGRKTESESTIEKAAKARRSVCPVPFL